MADTDPAVMAANAALDAHEADEERLLLELGRALKRARETHVSDYGTPTRHPGPRALCRVCPPAASVEEK